MCLGSTILLAEDEANDAFFVRWAFEKAGLPHKIAHVYDGQEALDYLSGASQYSDRQRYPVPALLLLDLKMPRLGGFDVLEWLKTRPEFRHLPVVIFSSSDNENDVRHARDLGAKEYRVKPSDIAKFVELAHHLDKKWLHGELQEA